MIWRKSDLPVLEVHKLHTPETTSWSIESQAYLLGGYVLTIHQNAVDVAIMQYATAAS